MYIQIAGGILNLLWFGLADLLRGRILLAVTKGIFHYFSLLFIMIILEFLGLTSNELALLIVLLAYGTVIFLDGYRTFKPDEQGSKLT